MKLFAAAIGEPPGAQEIRKLRFILLLLLLPLPGIRGQSGLLSGELFELLVEALIFLFLFRALQRLSIFGDQPAHFFAYNMEDFELLDRFRFAVRIRLFFFAGQVTRVLFLYFFKYLLVLIHLNQQSRNIWKRRSFRARKGENRIVYRRVVFSACNGNQVLASAAAEFDPVRRLNSVHRSTIVVIELLFAGPFAQNQMRLRVKE